MHHLVPVEPLKILVVEDNPGDFLLLKAHLETSAIAVAAVDHVDHLGSAKEYLQVNKPDIIFLDLFLPDGEGLCSYNELQPYIGQSAVIILSGLSDIKTALDAIANGAQDYLEKGEFNEKLFARTIMYAIERRKNIERLKVANERYSLVTKATQDLVWDWDLVTGKIFRDEQAVKDVYGCAHETIEFIDEWNKHIHPDDAMRVSTMIDEIKHSVTKDFFDIEYRFRSESGDYRYIYDRGYIVRNSAGYPIRLIGAANDITEKKKLQQALQEEKMRQQRAVAEATIRGQENERQQLGIELHDNITQILATARLYLESTAGTNAEACKIAKSKDLIVLATKELRKLSHSLLPPSLHEFGLKQALDELTGTIAETGHLLFDNQWEDFDQGLLDKDQQLTIYRIVQEQLNNIIKHAGATRVRIGLSISGNEHVELSISDNGKGFDPSLKRNGVGLRNIISRVEYYYGHANIHSRPGHGCELNVVFPVMAEYLRQHAS
jgi:two-component system sensor histidine kinase UhpB